MAQLNYHATIVYQVVVVVVVDSIDTSNQLKYEGLINNCF
jgi:hypothetical protein